MVRMSNVKKRPVKSFLAKRLGVHDDINKVSFKYLLKITGQRYWHALFALIYILLVAEFRILEKYIVPIFWVSCPLDQYIPFLPIFVIPYTMWYPMIAFVLIPLCFHDREDFLKACMSVFTGMFVAMLIFILFPNGQTLRPVMTDDGALANFVRTSIYSRDTNTNSFPSIHAIKQISLQVAICKSKLWGNNKPFKRVTLVITILVCASTVFIKQHSILDVILSLILSIPIYIFVYKSDWLSFFPGVIKSKLINLGNKEIKPQFKTQK